MTLPLPFEDFLKRSNKVHGGKFSYVDSSYRTASGKVSIICPVHGEFRQTAQKHLGGQGCPSCSPRWTLYSKETFVEKSKEKHGDRFDYSKSNYINAKTKIEIICPIHGSFWQIPKSHFLNGYGCRKCSMKVVHDSQRRSQQDFLAKCKILHGDLYSYEKVDYKTARKKVIITCEKHGDFKITPDSHLTGRCGCPQCSSSFGENKVRNFLKSVDAPFVEQHWFANCRDQKPLKFDFYLGPFLIEFQGAQHYKPVKKWGGLKNFKGIQKRDQIKRDYCKNNGLTILEIKYDDKKWKEKIENVLFAYLI